MKFALLKFNYGVEIGARLAYLGHYAATGDKHILAIADEELEHRRTILKILDANGQKPFAVVNLIFTVVGSVIKSACMVCPKFMLNFVARTMEAFAIFNYTKLANLFPEHKDTFLEMAAAEQRHEDYFKN